MKSVLIHLDAATAKALDRIAPAMRGTRPALPELY